MVCGTFILNASCKSNNGGQAAADPEIQQDEKLPEVDNETIMKESEYAQIMEMIKNFYAGIPDPALEWEEQEKWWSENKPAFTTGRFNLYTSRLDYDILTQSQDPHPMNVGIAPSDDWANGFDIAFPGYSRPVVLLFAKEEGVWKVDNIIETDLEGRMSVIATIDYNRPASDYDVFGEQ